jgi:hypothetical protein
MLFGFVNTIINNSKLFFMATKQVSWTRNWPSQDYTNFSKTQIVNAKRIYEALATIRIDTQIKKLGKKITYKLRWKRDRSQPSYYLLTYTNPPAKEIPKKGKNRHGIGQSNVSPTPPPKP